MEKLQIENTISEMKNLSGWLDSKLDTNEDRSIESF